MTGSLDPDLRETRNVVSSRRRREQHDAWKDRNFERYWGEVLSSKGTTKDNAKAPCQCRHRHRGAGGKRSARTR